MMQDDDDQEIPEAVADDAESVEESATLEDEEPGELDTSAQKNEDEAEGEETPKPKRRSYAKRIGQLTAEKRAAERERDQLRDEIQRRQTQPQTQREMPKRDDFDNYEDYLDAKAEFKAEFVVQKEIAQAEAQQKRRTQEQAETQQIAAYNEAREELLSAGQDAYEDFEEIAMSEALTISPHMADAVLVAERGAEVLYHLGKNPKLAERIAAMPPVKQLIELGKIEASLSSTKKPSGAPAPTRSVNARGPSSNVLRDNLSINDWMKRRNAEVRKLS